MSRSTLICSLVAELLFAPVALAGPPDKGAKCLADCETMKKKFEKSCKQHGGGRCEGRGKAMVDDLDKRCKEECAKRKK